MKKAQIIVSMGTFTRHYLIAALWSSNDNANDQGGEPLDRNYDIENFTNASLLKAKADCETFQKENEADLKLYYEHWGQEYAGHDLWLTAQRHGAGFWDRYVQGEPETNALMKPVLERLTEASHKLAEDIYLY
jgi:hypothetical protein